MCTGGSEWPKKAKKLHKFFSIFLSEVVAVAQFIHKHQAVKPKACREVPQAMCISVRDECSNVFPNMCFILVKLCMFKAKRAPRIVQISLWITVAK